MVIVRSWVGQLALQVLWALRVLPVPWVQAVPECPPPEVAELLCGVSAT